MRVGVSTNVCNTNIHVNIDDQLMIESWIFQATTLSNKCDIEFKYTHVSARNYSFLNGCDQLATNFKIH